MPKMEKIGHSFTLETPSRQASMPLDVSVKLAERPEPAPTRPVLHAPLY
jgi:hypothetical protein